MAEFSVRCAGPVLPPPELALTGSVRRVKVRLGVRGAVRHRSRKASTAEATPSAAALATSCPYPANPITSAFGSAALSASTALRNADSGSCFRKRGASVSRSSGIARRRRGVC